MYAAIGGGVVVLALGAYFALSGGNEPTAPATEAPVSPVGQGSPSEAAAASAAEKSAAETKPGTPPAARGEPDEPEPAIDQSGSREMVRFRLAMRGATTAQQHFDAAQTGKAQLEAVKKNDPQSAEITEFESRIRGELRKAIETDPEFAPAHLELGDVLYSKSEAARWLASDLMPAKLRTALQEVIETSDPEREAEKTRRGLGEAPDAIWLGGVLAARNGPTLSEVRTLHEDRGSTKVSWFYEKARKAALRIEGEIGHYFSEDRNRDAFDPVIFRPYVVMVQKDAEKRSVDRAYEVVRLFRMLEDTWRRRYSKEIEFSGSMSAPPIILLRSQKDYAKYIQRHESVVVVSAGHYEPSGRRMVIYHSNADDERNVIFHEGTHVLFDHKNSAKDPETQAKQSMWFAEGVAEYFGGHGPTGEKDPVTASPIYEPGRVNDTRIGAIDVARRFKRLIGFEELIGITRLEWNQRNTKDMLWAQMTYAQGWALVYYLNHGESGKYQKDFVEYMKLELTGKSGMEAFKQVFGKHGLDKIEKGYEEFIDYVIKKHAAKKIVGGKFVD